MVDHHEDVVQERLSQSDAIMREVEAATAFYQLARFWQLALQHLLILPEPTARRSAQILSARIIRRVDMMDSKKLREDLNKIMPGYNWNDRR